MTDFAFYSMAISALLALLLSARAGVQMGDGPLDWFVSGTIAFAVVGLPTTAFGCMALYAIRGLARAW